LVHRSTEADARELVTTGAAQAEAPAKPMFRSNLRREIRLSSITYLPEAVLPSLRGLTDGPDAPTPEQHLVVQTPVFVSHAVQPFQVMQTPARKSLQSASLAQACVSEQNWSSAQNVLRSPNRAKHIEPSPTWLLHVPQPAHPFVQLPNSPRHSRRDAGFVQRSTEAEARTLVSTGEAQAASPAAPMLRSNERREIRLSSTLRPVPPLGYPAAVRPSR
jgi:hypothetical protein